MPDTELITALKKFFGHPPYDGPENIVRSDGYFWKSIEDKWGSRTVKAACAELGERITE